MRLHFGVVTLAVLVAGVDGNAQNTSLDVSGFDVAVDYSGNIKLPELPFRTNWVLLGSWTVNGEDGAEGMHIVYTQPGVVEAYRATGAFPDGTVIVKELRGSSAEDLTTGRVSYVAELQGWFVMVRDATGRYPDNPLWGDGWGWGFFEAGSPRVLVTEDYKSECIACHIPAQETDWIYTRAYPVLAEE